ncbi:hypothetical protein ES703_92345 [subsurface metagenome]
MELSADFYEEEEKKAEDKPFHEFSYSSIFDMSDIRPGEIEIEDEIKMGYLWRRYGRHEPK